MVDIITNIDANDDYKYKIYKQSLTIIQFSNSELTFQCWHHIPKIANECLELFPTIVFDDEDALKLVDDSCIKYIYTLQSLNSDILPNETVSISNYHL